MLLRLLTLISCIHLCAFTSCDDDCFAFFEGGTLEVELENAPSFTYDLGDTLWLAADFSTNLENVGGTGTLTETGGLFVTRMLRVAPDSVNLLPALTAFTPLVTRGSFTFEDENLDPAATLLRYRCPNGRCGFRQGFRLDSVGQYILEVNGSAFDLAGETIGRCVADRFAETSLNTPNNFAAVTLRLPLTYSPEGGLGLMQNIDTTFRQNLLYFTVE